MLELGDAFLFAIRGPNLIFMTINSIATRRNARLSVSFQ